MAEIQGRIQGFNKSRFIMIILLPQEAGPLRTRVKHWGDVVTGEAPFRSLEFVGLTP